MINRIIISLTFLLTLLFAPLAISQGANPDSTPGVTGSDQAWNLKDVDITTLAYEVSKATGKNFIVGPKVNDKVTFITSKPLPKAELYQAFVTLLNAYGYAAVPDGKVIKIISNSTRNQLRPDLRPKNKLESDSIALRVVRVDNYPAAEMIKIIRPLIPIYSFVDEYRPANDIIVADHVQHIDEILDLIKKLDQPTTKDFEIIKLKYATADDMAKTLNALIKNPSGVVTGRNITASIVAEPRSNSLVISGARFDQLRNIQQLVSRLDLPDDIANERTEVIYLRYIPAETVAPIVSGLVESYLAEEEAKDPRKGQNTDQANLAGSTTNTSSSSSSGLSRSMSGQFNLQDPRSNLTGSSTLTGSLGSYTSTPPKSGTIGSHVQWEQSTNSIILTAPAAVIRRVQSVIREIDIRRPQVLIEAVIAEVSVERAHELGIEWANYGGTQLNTRFPTKFPLSSIGQDGNYSVAGAANSIGQGLTFGIFNMGNLRFLLRALAADTDANILATPNIVTLDNEPALIKVGRKVSFTVGQINNNPTGGNPFNSFNREDVGLVLSVKPTITPEGSIRLNISQELSTVLEGTERAAGGNPDTSERFIQTTVIADNDQILVMGGLLQKEWGRTKDKVPVLGNIPVLGALFSNQYKRLRNTNLMIFLHPVILYGPDDNNLVTNGKYEFLRQSQLHLQYPTAQVKEKPVLPLRESPVVIPPPFCMDMAAPSSAQRHRAIKG